MTRLSLRPLPLLVAMSAFIAAVAGCGDNADDLAKARASRKSPTNKGSTNGDENAVGATTPGGLPIQPVDAGFGGGGGTCQPQQVSLNVQWRPPHALHQQACTAQEVSVLANCYFAQQGCEQTISAPCHQCAVSSAVASTTYGAIIVDEEGKQEPELNVEGCVAAMTGDVSTNGCGARLKAAFACQSQACAACDDTNFAQCRQAAESGVCAQYAQAAAPCASALAQCTGSGTPSQVATSMIQLFCM